MATESNGMTGVVTRDSEQMNKLVPGGGAADTMMEKLAERVGGVANSAAVFAPAIERDGVTVIPVARVRWGFGGGGGSGSGPASKEADAPQGSGSGSGGGGGAIATPAGYIKIKDGDASFEAIKSPPGPGRYVGIAAIFVAAGFAIARILKGARGIVETSLEKR